MKHKKLLSIISIIVLIYGAGFIYASHSILPSTTLHHQPIDNLDNEALTNIIKNNQLVINVKDARESIEIPLDQFDFNIINNESIKQDVIANQNAFLWPIHLVNGQNVEAIQIDVDSKQLNKVLDKHDVFNEEGLVVSKDASFDIDENNQVIINDEVVGEVLNKDLSRERILSSLNAGNYTINLNDAIIQPNIVRSDLVNLTDEVETKIQVPLSLRVDEDVPVHEILPTSKLNFLSIDTDTQSVGVNTEAITNYVKALNKQIKEETPNHNHVYELLGAGGIRRVEKGQNIVGFEVDNTSSQINDALVNLTPLSEGGETKIISKPKVTYKGMESSDGNFVEVNINTQTVYLFEQGVLTYTAPVVTGNPWSRTHPGVFVINAMFRHYTLKGSNVEKNNPSYTYNIPVEYWMPFDQHIGLHDLSTRSYESFGGSTYMGNGSHGCVNMRLESARRIFNSVSVGTGVWVSGHY